MNNSLTYGEADFLDTYRKLTEAHKTAVIELTRTLLSRDRGPAEKPTWTGYYRGINREGNTIYPEWG